MKPKTLEGRMKAKKLETIELLKKEARYVEFSEETGFVYELVKNVYGKLNKIILGLKNGHISVVSMTEIDQRK